MEVEIARFVGPVAKVLVRRAARQHKDLPALVAALAVSIDTSPEREAFARAVTGRGLSQNTQPMLVATEGTDTSFGETMMTGPAVSEQDMERATRVLTSYIGPIAKVVTKRAAVRRRQPARFFRARSPKPRYRSQRERFLREAGFAGR